MSARRRGHAATTPRTTRRCDRSARLHSRLAQIFAHHGGVLRDRDLRFRQLGVPPLLPFEAVEAAVAASRQRLDLPAHRYLTLPGEHVLAVAAGGHGVLEMRVPDV